MAKKKQTTEQLRDPIVNDWAGNERFACPVDGCAFDTLNREHFDEHMRWNHPLPADDVVTTEGDADGAPNTD